MSHGAGFHSLYAPDFTEKDDAAQPTDYTSVSRRRQPYSAPQHEFIDDDDDDDDHEREEAGFEKRKRIFDRDIELEQSRQSSRKLSKILGGSAAAAKTRLNKTAKNKTPKVEEKKKKASEKKPKARKDEKKKRPTKTGLLEGLSKSQLITLLCQAAGGKRNSKTN